MAGDGGTAAERAAAAVEAAAAGGWEFRNAYRRQLLALSRRIRLLGPFAEELREARRGPADGEKERERERALAPLADALERALDLLRLGRDGSRIFLVLERDNVMKKFQAVIAQLEQALCDFPYDKLDISDEVREQVELVHAQLRRAKERADMPDDEFYNDVLSLYNKSYDPSAELDILERLSEKLHLMTITDLTQESLALHEMVASGGGQDPGEHIEKMSMLLKKIKDFVQTQNPEMGPPIGTKLMDSNGEPRPVNIPDEFRCPISLELMKDPVIVATGQTYERVCIEKWLVGHHTCPKTQQRMTNTTLTTNYVLRSLIAQWCEANGIEPPKRSSQPNKPTPACSLSERANIDALLSQLCSHDPEEQRSAAAELRLLAKRNANNRICIAEAGAIPLLLSLLSSFDLRTQEHAVTALLNLSIHEDNKASIISSGAVPSIVHVLKNGSMEARENAAATLFSLSVIDEYKVTIGGTGAIPALVVLLSEGSQRGKKDAAAALFNLCIYQGNKGRAIRAGLVPLIMGLVTNPTGALMDEAMAILSILSSHPEGKAAIGAAEPVPVLVEMIGSGSPRNRENAAAVMLHLCSGEQQLVHLARAQECGIMVPLRELALNGTERGKRKAVLLLERMSRFLVQQQEEKEAQLLASAQAIPRLPEQVQETEIPEQLDSPSP
ncbi:protein spotted leaf 11-like [Panicum miliaceum]|uniref:RING-type E3 ubiquitin transferase n=1 Tax=Panicum miliaceum TaxID=4540 RepID=A0A3L6R971_PANMI|nr:protein spotted leaf 11-like [Panicum miliaceum]